MRRAASRARSAAFAATTSSRSRRSPTSRELNVLLLAGCEADLAPADRGRARDGRRGVGDERPLLVALPARAFDSAEAAAPRVDQKSLVTIRQNRYSVPVALAGLKVSARVGAREITISHGGQEVARHERLHGKFGTSAQLDHYLELLLRKPGGLERSLALAQERDRGAWPDCSTSCGRRWPAVTAARRLPGRWSTSLLLCREHGPDQVALAVRGALATGAIDGRAVAVLARRAQSTASRARAVTGLEPRLAAHAPGAGPHRL